MEIKEQAPQGLVLIQGYGDGGFTLNAERHDGPVLVFGDKSYAWPLKSKAITKTSLKPLLDQDPGPEFIILGLGDEVTDPVILARKLSKSLDISVEVMTTGAAARTYNVLTLEGRRVAAGLLPV